MTSRVPTVRTVLLPNEALGALWHAHQDVVGGPCEEALLGILAAHTAFETARWRSMFNWNPGNRGGHSETGEWATFAGATEVVNGHVVPRVGGEAGGFGAWGTCADGFRSYVRFLACATNPPKPNRYAEAWAAARIGDVVAFCAELRTHGYYTDDVRHYTNGVRDQLVWLNHGALPDFLATLTPSTPMVTLPESANE